MEIFDANTVVMVIHGVTTEYLNLSCERTLWNATQEANSSNSEQYTAWSPHDHFATFMH